LLKHYKQYDENDPNDRRRSQLLFKAQLDEIEKVRRLAPTFSDNFDDGFLLSDACF
jgi:hypothetical protein